MQPFLGAPGLVDAPELNEAVVPLREALDLLDLAEEDHRIVQHLRVHAHRGRVAHPESVAHRLLLPFRPLEGALEVHADRRSRDPPSVHGLLRSDGLVGRCEVQKGGISGADEREAGKGAELGELVFEEGFVGGGGEPADPEVLAGLGGAGELDLHRGGERGLGPPRVGGGSEHDEGVGAGGEGGGGVERGELEEDRHEIGAGGVRGEVADPEVGGGSGRRAAEAAVGGARRRHEDY